jgi:lactoylglutathione lyase
MKIEHIAIWVKDLERMRAFYENYFGARSNELYHNPVKQFQSYFLSFDSGCRLELMHSPKIKDHNKDYEKQSLGIIHLAISVGGRKQVDDLSIKLQSDGYMLVGKPRVTGDGYYESVVLDPENNIIEITE